MSQDSLESHSKGELIQGRLKDPKRWWLFSDCCKMDKELRRRFMSRDRGKHGVRKKRFKR